MKRTSSLQDICRIPPVIPENSANGTKGGNSMGASSCDESGGTEHLRSRSIDLNVQHMRSLRCKTLLGGGKRKDRRYASDNTLVAHRGGNGCTVPAKELYDLQLPENPYDMVARLFWIGVSLLESDYEHEFLLAIRLVEKVGGNGLIALIIGCMKV